MLQNGGMTARPVNLNLTSQHTAERNQSTKLHKNMIEPLETQPKINAPMRSNTAICSHSKKRVVGKTVIGMGSVTVYWCPECGALKKTMTNWENKDYPWEIPS